MTKYKRVYIGRGIKPIDECPKCGNPGYLDAQWIARENTMTWCGPYFSVNHFDRDEETGEIIKSPRHYIGISYRSMFPELEKEPPSVEWIRNWRVEKGFSSWKDYIDPEKRKKQRLRAEIRDHLMDLTHEELLSVINVLKDGGTKVA